MTFCFLKKYTLLYKVVIEFLKVPFKRKKMIAFLNFKDLFKIDYPYALSIRATCVHTAVHWKL